MDAGLIVAVALALAFAVTNGMHDASNAIATLVATRRRGRLQAVAARGGVQPPRPAARRRRRRRHDRRHRHGRPPRRRGHRRRPGGRGGLERGHVGARAAVELRATRWSAASSAPPSWPAEPTPSTGAGSTACTRSAYSGRSIALAVSPVLGALAALLLDPRAAAAAGRRATRRWAAPAAARSGRCRRRSRSATAPTTRRSRSASSRRCCSPPDTSTASAPRSGHRSPARAALTAGTALGGWRIMRTVGRRIYRIQPVDGLASQAASAAVIFGASLARRAGLHDPGRRVIGRRRRRRPAALAPRPLGDRAPDGARPGW